MPPPVKNAELSVKTVVAGNRISNIQIICSRTGVQQIAAFDYSEFKKSVSNSRGNLFLQQWLKNLVVNMGYSNVQEVLWFLMTVLNEKFGLKAETGKFIQLNFVNYLTELERTITKILMDKALEQVK